jgi:hypothetical protein
MNKVLSGKRYLEPVKDPSDPCNQHIRRSSFGSHNVKESA